MIGRHPPAADLLLLLDAPEAARGGGHVAGCELCRRRAARLRARLAHVDASLALLDPSPGQAARALERRLPGRPPRTHPLRSVARAAAAVLLLAVVATPALSALATRREAERREALSASGTPAASAVRAGAVHRSPAPGAGRDSAQFRFTPRDGALRLVIASGQDAGSLLVTRSDDSQAMLEIWHTAGTVQPPVLITPGSVLISNAATTRADYRLLVPARVGRVRVQVAGGGQRLISAAMLRGGAPVEIVLR